MINQLKKIEAFLKSVVGIFLALGSVLTALGFIYSGIIRLNNTVTDLAKSVPLVEEHSIFTNQEVDYMIDECLDMLNSQKEIPRRLIAKLLVYRDTMPKTLNYKQRMNIDYIARKTNYK